MERYLHDYELKFNFKLMAFKMDSQLLKEMYMKSIVFHFQQHHGKIWRFNAGENGLGLGRTNFEILN